MLQNEIQQKEEICSKNLLVNKCVTIYIRKTSLIKKAFKMLNHIENNILETELRYKKIYTISKFIKDIQSLDKFKLNVQDLGLSLLDKRWINIVTNNGYLSVHKTIDNLSIPEKFNWVDFTKNDE